MTAPTPPTVHRGVWWLSPPGAVVLVTLPSVLWAHQLPWDLYLTAWRTPKWLDDGSLWLILAALAAFTLPAALMRISGGRSRVDGSWPGLTPAGRVRLRTAATTLFWVTMLGYAVFIGAAVARGLRPSTVADTVASQNVLDSGLKGDVFQSIPGLTTLTQVGIAFTIVATLLLVGTFERRLLLQLILVVALALGRAYLLAERLALLELVLPIAAVLACAFRDKVRRTGAVWALRLVPLVAVPATVIYFGLLEYSRSWNYFRARSQGGFWDFALERFTGYYVTAVNNGQIQLLHQPEGQLPRETMLAFWEAPVISQLDLYGSLAPRNTVEYADTLARFGNPEFNSPCGICSPLIDWGTAGGFIWLALAGAAAGLLYGQFCRAGLAGLLLYPLVVTSLFELPRLIYLSQGRTTPAVIGLIGTWLYVRPTQGAGQHRAVGVSDRGGEADRTRDDDPADRDEPAGHDAARSVGP